MDAAAATPVIPFTPPSFSTETLYYVTALSNLVRAYDKYGRVYDKARIAECTYPDRFFLLARKELEIGLRKAAHLPAKTAHPGDRLLVIQTHAAAGELRPNLRNGLGRFVERGFIHVDALHFVDAAGDLIPVELEDACALALRSVASVLSPFDALVPRSVSVLPIASACQARCRFCFSKASASVDVPPDTIDWTRVREVFRVGRERGARRAVITGGGEPMLIGDASLEELVRESARHFSKVVLISNGARWGLATETDRTAALLRLHEAGLSVLALSRHHFNDDRNSEIMNLRTGSEFAAQSLANLNEESEKLKLRWICVLQRGGVEDTASLEAYLDWAASTGAQEVCFKELYVSTSVESEYHDRVANQWSRDHQIPLSLITSAARDHGWKLIERLPWGAPVFAADWRGRPLRIAAYTEPSVFWERSNGLCRSWNLMADGRCLASLEDRNSEVMPRGLRQLQTRS